MTNSNSNNNSNIMTIITNNSSHSSNSSRRKNSVWKISTVAAAINLSRHRPIRVPSRHSRTTTTATTSARRTICEVAPQPNRHIKLSSSLWRRKAGPTKTTWKAVHRKKASSNKTRTAAISNRAMIRTNNSTMAVVTTTITNKTTIIMTSNSSNITMINHSITTISNSNNKIHITMLKATIHRIIRTIKCSKIVPHIRHPKSKLSATQISWWAAQVSPAAPWLVLRRAWPIEHVNESTNRNKPNLASKPGKPSKIHGDTKPSNVLGMITRRLSTSNGSNSSNSNSSNIKIRLFSTNSRTFIRISLSKILGIHISMLRLANQKSVAITFRLTARANSRRAKLHNSQRPISSSLM